MEEKVEFETGPYGLLKYSVREKDGNYFIEVNDGELGSLRVENLETVNELRNILDNIENEIKERNRQKEEL